MSRLVAVGALALVGVASASAASPPVTIFARPSVVATPSTAVTLSGSVASGKAGEDVAIQAKDCGSERFRVVAGAVTREGGGWTTYASYFPRISTRLRAVWNDETSAELVVRVRAGVILRKHLGTLRVAAYGGAEGVRLFRGKYVLFQRFNRRLGTWVDLKRVVLTESTGAGTTVRTSLPNGTRVRALLPASQAGPCFLPGVSMIARVGP